MATQPPLPGKLGEIQKALEADVAEIKKIEAEFTKVYGARQTLIEKKNENEMVLSEFNLMDGEATVYKLVGPLLAKQDLPEAKSNVEKRIEFITREIERMDKLEVDFKSKIEEKRKNVMKLQEDFRRIAMQQQQAAAGGQPQ
ncbi:UNKNOWN [Stylonychia lemnae]|uniref:Prefoldin subunit 6 n=1 Tax=Stylonychia lemnae TaxID=5949 RepID=A0A077ZT57_STYLE|nr:UNKNOWN [Stylonychia lemnae]|eukprot:CDW72495.1 UNKNOWN [Stylonychia lemnae]